MLRIFWLIAILSFTATDSYGQRIRDATEPPATLRRPKPVPKRKPQLSEVSECAKLISESQYSSPKAAVADVAGKGYDVLQETLMMPASDTHFYMCNLLRRGNMFVPDNVYVTSVHKTRLTMDSRYINSFEGSSKPRIKQVFRVV